ncbi:MAG: hypothetical protein ABEJ02_01995 [Candidatus Paceibacteria bacterium]
MRFFTLETKKEQLDKFLEFWGQFYHNNNTKQYKKYINQDELDQRQLELFSKWRNNSENLNQAKQAVWGQVEGKIELLNEFRQQEKVNLKRFRDEFGFLRPRWLIYLLHWASPKKYPIFDQYTFTAQRYIQFQTLEELPYQDKIIERFYFNHFVPDFYRQLNKKDLSGLQIYQGLASFGKFLIRLTELEDNY